ncbi:MAG: hypothetical protein ABI477_03515 [Chryseolinea sp.]
MENTRLPAFNDRTLKRPGEGWALDPESQGKQHGLYTDPSTGEYLVAKYTDNPTCSSMLVSIHKDGHVSK